MFSIIFLIVFMYFSIKIFDKMFDWMIGVMDRHPSIRNILGMFVAYSAYKGIKRYFEDLKNK